MDECWAQQDGSEMRAGGVSMAIAGSRSSHARRVYCFLVLSLAATVSCASDVTADLDLSGDVTSIAPALPTGFSVAGGPPVTVSITARNATDVVSPAVVRWEVGPSSGVVSVQESRTGPDGVATTSWTLPTKI